ncbi:MAG: hypothetical protein AAF559_03435 [Pseudomonadota bacterium]
MPVNQLFAAKDVYFAALLGSLMGYFGFVGLVSVSSFVGTGQIGEVLAVFITGLLFGILPAAAASALVIAPIAMLIAYRALGWLPETRWHGAATGVLTAIAVIAILLVILSSEWRETPDAGTIAFLIGAMVVAAVSGWTAQRAFLRGRAPITA